MAEGFTEYTVRGKSKFGGQANKKAQAQAEEFSIGDATAADIKERFLLRLKVKPSHHYLTLFFSEFVFTKCLLN
jgi:hypothetical protein